MAARRARKKRVVEQELDETNSVQLQVGLTQTGQVRVAMVGSSESCQDGFGFLTLDLSPDEAADIFRSFAELIPLATKLQERPGLWIANEGSA